MPVAEVQTWLVGDDSSFFEQYRLQEQIVKLEGVNGHGTTMIAPTSALRGRHWSDGN